jgi:hypothetical protein
VSLIAALLGAAIAAGPVDPVAVFEKACLQTPAEVADLMKLARDEGWSARPNARSSFEDTPDDLIVFNAGQVEVRLEITEPKRERVRLPGRSGRAWSIRESSGSAFCMVTIPGGGASLGDRLRRLVVEGAALGAPNPGVGPGGNHWAVSRGSIVDVQYVFDADDSRPHAAATLAANRRR